MSDDPKPIKDPGLLTDLTNAFVECMYAEEGSFEERHHARRVEKLFFSFMEKHPDETIESVAWRMSQLGNNNVPLDYAVGDLLYVLHRIDTSSDEAE